VTKCEIEAQNFRGRPQIRISRPFFQAVAGDALSESLNSGTSSGRSDRVVLVRRSVSAPAAYYE
jgi:hypothetical protein